MNPGTVAGGSLDIDFSAAHRVAGRIAAAAVNDDLPGVHRVPGRVLRIAEHLNSAAVGVSAQRIARNAVNAQVLSGKAAGNVALPHAACKLDVGVHTGVNFFVEKLKMLAVGVELSHGLFLLMCSFEIRCMVNFVFLLSVGRKLMGYS